MKKILFQNVLHQQLQLKQQVCKNETSFFAAIFLLCETTFNHIHTLVPGTPSRSGKGGSSSTMPGNRPDIQFGGFECVLSLIFPPNDAFVVVNVPIHCP